jgi:hypothetical protein
MGAGSNGTVQVAAALAPPVAGAPAPGALGALALGAVSAEPALDDPLLPPKVASDPDGAAGSSVRLQAQPKASQKAKNPMRRPRRSMGVF